MNAQWYNVGVDYTLLCYYVTVQTSQCNFNQLFWIRLEFTRNKSLLNSDAILIASYIIVVITCGKNIYEKPSWLYLLTLSDFQILGKHTLFPSETY